MHTGGFRPLSVKIGRGDIVEVDIIHLLGKISDHGAARRVIIFVLSVATGLGKNRKSGPERMVS